VRNRPLDARRMPFASEMGKTALRWRQMARWLLGPIAALMLLCAPAAAPAAGVEDPALQWLPRTDGAAWVYSWSNSAYSPVPRQERYSVTARRGTTFRVSWTEPGVDPPQAGFADYNHTDAGLVNTQYQSTQPPSQFPLLCATATQCGNSVAGTHFLTFWGTRSPVLAEPLVIGTRWNTIGGANNEVTSRNRYSGRETIAVPAFPGGVEAAKIDSDITHTGALGDPFGSGSRTVWWVYGVGPVRIVLRHGGGEMSVAELQSTSLAPQTPPSDVNLLPLGEGRQASFRWRNSKHMRAWSRQRFTVRRVVNNTSRVEVRQLSGPLAAAGAYVFASRLSGVRRLTSKISRGSDDVDFPRLGPTSGAPWRFLTPYDLMTYGFNPVLPAYPERGMSWRSSRDHPDWATFGVVGVSRVIGRQTVRTRAGRFRRALVVRSDLRQPGRKFGTGERTMWFAPGRGLVKLVFRHDDGSVSTVERIP
jgi:hypothetical protein